MREIPLTLGKKGETDDQLVNRIMDRLEEYERRCG